MFIITLISKYLFQLFIDRGRLSYRLHDNFSFRIDKYLCRESGNPIKFYHITNLPVLVIQNLGPGHLILLNSLQPNFPGIGSVFLGNIDHFKPLRPIMRLKRFQKGMGSPARATPRPPEIQQHIFSSQIRQVTTCSRKWVIFIL